MTLHLPLVFHFNQHLTDFAWVASRACYRGLLRVLRNHPAVPCNIHISGTLVHALQWLDPEPLELIRDGLRDGQFELLGSTYAQNVPYATDDRDNFQQIALHQRTLHDCFGVTPVGFWNPERCWRQSLVPLIAGAGYRTTLIEDHILMAGGLTAPAVVTTHQDDYRLNIVWDDEKLKQLFNFAAWFGRPAQLLAYLRERINQAADRPLCLAYAEDAEAMGLWGWQKGVAPQQTWYYLDELLTLLQSQPGLQIVHLSAAPSPVADLSPIPDGSAAWMDAALQREEAPYHEDGYANWFHFLATAPKIAHFRQLYDELRLPLPHAADGQAGRAFHEAAWHTFLTYQYEFGCIGIGGPGYAGWEGARASGAFGRAADWAREARPFHLVEDVNHDGREEIVLSDGGQAIVLTPAGGRLLYWLDLTEGRQWLGNPLPVTWGRYEGDSALPLPFPYLARWLPDDFAARPLLPEASLTAEEGPTRLAPFLAEWVWANESGPFPLLLYPPESLGLAERRPARRRGLVDHFQLDGGEEAAAGEWLEYRLGSELSPVTSHQVTFVRPLHPAIHLQKSYSLAGRRIHAHYAFTNRDVAVHRLQWRVTNELCPDYAEVVRHGRHTLAFTEAGGDQGVVNTRSGRTILLHSSLPPAGIETAEVLLALELSLAFEMELEPESEMGLELQLYLTP
ncbi:MAG: hypothetical protein AB1791_06305 [Chloroflexota bacterium]